MCDGVSVTIQSVRMSIALFCATVGLVLFEWLFLLNGSDRARTQGCSLRSFPCPHTGRFGHGEA